MQRTVAGTVYIDVDRGPSRTELSCGVVPDSRFSPDQRNRGGVPIRRIVPVTQRGILNGLGLHPNRPGKGQQKREGKKGDEADVHVGKDRRGLDWGWVAETTRPDNPCTSRTYAG